MNLISSRAARKAFRAFLVLLTSAQWFLLAAEAGDTRSKVAQAVDSIRGRDVSQLSESEVEALDNRLGEAWRIILDNPKESKPLVRAALTQEREDSFRIIDLSHLLIVLEPKLMAEATAAVTKVDPNAYPDGYFRVASLMAASHCEKCLPAVLKMLALKQLDTGIQEHALPVNLELGLIFSIGQYGNAAIAGVLSSLESEDCVIRGNAALAVGFLLPQDEPSRLRKMASKDPCEESRRGAWQALGSLDSPSLASLVTARLAGASVSVGERKAMVTGLSLAFSRDVLRPLRTLSGDADPEVAKAAATGIEVIEKHAPTPAELKEKLGSGTFLVRSRGQRLLKDAKKDGRFEFDGQPLELLPSLVPGDLTLVNEARAAVLNRTTDECLYEYFPLTYIARALRTASRTEKAEDPPTDMPAQAPVPY